MHSPVPDGRAILDRAPTIDDVAALSGVARTTVSRVLNNRPNVRPEMRERVERAMADLGYTANPQARTLAGGRSRTLALICSTDEEAEPNSYYRSALEIGALRACTRNGLQLITQSVVQTAPDRAERILALVHDARASGVILTPPFCDDATLVRALCDCGYAVVSISPGSDAQALAPSVGIDDQQAGADIAEHLLALGHRRLCFLQGIAGHLSAEQRQRGVEQSLARHGIDPASLRLARGDFTFRSGKAMLPQLLGDRITAVICANDDMAAGALFAAHQLGIDVPHALSITGFDDTPVSAIVWPPLTTVHQPLQRLGEQAVQMMVDRQRGGADGLTTASEMLVHHVRIRGSSAAPANHD